jgi:hypothetical protein
MNNIFKNSLKLYNSIKLNKINLSISLLHTSNKLNGTQHYPINDDVFGLNEEQKQVCFR